MHLSKELIMKRVKGFFHRISHRPIITKDGLAKRKPLAIRMLNRASFEIRFHLHRLRPNEIEAASKEELLQAVCSKAGARQQFSLKGGGASSRLKTKEIYRFIDPDTYEPIY